MSAAQVFFIGRVGRKPELKGEGDKMYTVVSVAVSRFAGEGKGDPDKNGNPTKDVTDWYNVKYFKATAKYVCERVNPGDSISVTGKQELSTYEKKDKDGNLIDPKALGLNVIASDFNGPYRLVPKAESSSSNENEAPRTSAPARPTAQAAPARNTRAAAQSVPDDDVPF